MNPRTLTIVGVALIATILFALFPRTAPAIAQPVEQSLSSSAKVAMQAKYTIETPGVNHCGISSCSYYFKRSATRAIAKHGVQSLAVILRFVPNLVAKTVIGLGGRFVVSKAREAARHNQCLRIRYGIPFGINADNSKYCLN